MSKASAGEDQEYFASCCPKHGDLWLDDGSCPQCEQEEAEEISSGNWFGIVAQSSCFATLPLGKRHTRVLGRTRDLQCTVRPSQAEFH